MNETVLEEADVDSSHRGPHHKHSPRHNHSPHQNHLNLLPAVKQPAYLPVITLDGQLMFVPHDSLPYRFPLSDVAASSTLEQHHNSIVINDGDPGRQASCHYGVPGAINAADDIILPTANLLHSSGADTSRRPSVDCRQQSSATSMPETSSTAQTVSQFSFSLFMYTYMCIRVCVYLPYVKYGKSEQI